MTYLITTFANLLQTSNQVAQTTMAPARDWLQPLRQWLNRYEIRNADQAHLICRLIPVQCPFARDIHFGGRTWLRIPPLCKLNPLYEEVVSLRFRALCYLADECGEDVRCYC